MFYTHESASVRLTGRFAPDGEAMTATAAGSRIEIAFRGNQIVLSFNIDGCVLPFPHLWIRVDGGARVETSVDRWLTVETKDAGEHYIEIIYKGGKEIQNRWYAPLQGKISFLGYEADGEARLWEDNRKTIELVGDSITEGVLTYDRRYYPDDQDNRVFEDDVCRTYGWLTAQALGLRSLHMGYGAVGVTHGGCGAVPKAADAYPYCWDGAPVTYGHPDFVLINHGANDRSASAETYIKEYRALLELVRNTHPDTKIIVLTAFCGAYPDALRQLVDDFNATHNDDVFFVDATLWVPLEPLHPLTDGHKLIADRLVPLLRERYGL
ncbi:MAG: SGNH/GDSL hydrolase family protein [Eubacteriales bacterium]